ncbi:hypothetical protein KRR40_21240 [Niabella defluvii]|nr:hypothetical protein KRR40_21240 [Niabella sp. I65]
MKSGKVKTFKSNNDGKRADNKCIKQGRLPGLHLYS